MTDEVVEQRTRQPAHPVLRIAEHGFAIGWVVVRVALDGFEVNRRPAQEALTHQPAKAEGLRSELEVMAHRDSPADAFRQREQFVGFGRAFREGFLQIDVAASLQAQPA